MQLARRQSRRTARLRGVASSAKRYFDTLIEANTIACGQKKSSPSRFEKRDGLQLIDGPVTWFVSKKKRPALQ
jgi:hypothetical protein